MGDFLLTVAAHLDREPDPDAWGVHVRDCGACFAGAPCSLEQVAWAARIAQAERARAAGACQCDEGR